MMPSHWKNRILAVTLLTFAVTSLIALQAQAAAVILGANLTTAQELTLAAGTPLNAAGAAAISYDTVSNTLDWNISFSGLSGLAAAAHFHGPAAPGVGAGVQVNIGSVSGLTSPMIGSAVITELQEADLLAGLWYVNVHTSLNPGGEIRGQALDISTLIGFSVALDSGQEVPAVNAATPASAIGSAIVVLDPASNLLTWDIDFSGLSGAATASHFHGPAAPGVAAGVQVNIGAVSGLTSPMIGSAVITAGQAADLLAGLWYINVHTVLNGSGEIRGQVVSAQDKIGFYRASTRRYYQDLNGNLTWDGPSGGDVFSSAFANVGDIPLIGDWNGDGLDEIGFYRPSTRRYYLDMNGNQTWDGPGGGDVFSSAFANSGDIPIVGDWNGDGTDNIGFYRPSTRRYYLDLNGNLTWDAPSGGDIFSAPFASGGDEPIIGDWDGDGADNIGFYRPSTRRYYLDLNGNLTWDAPSGGDIFSAAFAGTGDEPIIGDWNGDGADEIGFYRPSTRRYYFDLNGNLSWDAPSGGDIFSSTFANTGDEPIIGKW